MVSLAPGGFSSQGQSGDRLVSKVVSTAITALFKHADQVDTRIRAEPVTKLLQGSIDGFEFVGQGLAMHNGLRLDGLELYAQAVAIDFSRIFQGQVSLRQPIQATMRVVLTAEDLTASFNTSFILDKLKTLTWKDHPLSFQNIRVQLEAGGRIELFTQVKIASQEQWLDLTLQAAVDVEEQRRIHLKDPTISGHPDALPLGESLLQHVNQLLDLDRFSLEGTQLRLDRLRIQAGRMVAYGSAHIAQFPSTRSGQR